VNRALVDLILLSLRGRLLRRARLLRRPRYLIAFLAGVGYFVMIFGRNLTRWAWSGTGGWRGIPPLGSYEEAMHLAIGLGAALLVTCAWLLASSDPALRLTETEIDFLLPAPLPRRQIILYSLLRQQPGLLGSTLVIFFLPRSGVARTGGSVLLSLAGTWGLLTLADLHLKGVSLWKARVKELPPAAAGLRRALAAAVGAGWWIGLFTSVRLAWQAAGGTDSLSRDSGAFASALAQGIASGLGGALLAPFLWISSPVYGRLNGNPPLAGVLIVLALVALHGAWVVRSRASFEEATLKRARRESARKGVSRQERRARNARHHEPFRLAPAGPPEAAIAWKNLMLRTRAPLGRTAALTAAIPVFLTGVAAYFGPPVTILVAVFGIALLCGIPLFAGLVLRNDLRTDLLHTDLLRAWPLSGSRLVLAELLAPAVNTLLVMLLGCGMVAAGVAGEALHDSAERVLRLPAALAGAPPLLMLPVLLASLLIVGLAIALLSLAIFNLAVLLVPSWIGLGLNIRRGTAVLGQRLLVGIGYLLAMLVAALPVLLLLGGIAALHVFQEIAFHVWEIPLLALVTTLVLGIEVTILVRFAGAVWDRMDPSRELLTAGEGE
jgi:ABC-2 type transport system permease protein